MKKDLSLTFADHLKDYDITDKQTEFLTEYFRNGAKNASRACEVVGVSRSAYYKWCKNDPFVLAKDLAHKEAAIIRQLETEEVLDEAETALRNNVKDGKENSVFFTLKNLSPDKWQNDYIQGQRYIQNQKNEINIYNDGLDMSNKELLGLIKEMSRGVIDAEFQVTEGGDNESRVDEDTRGEDS